MSDTYVNGWKAFGGAKVQWEWESAKNSGKLMAYLFDHTLILFIKLYHITIVSKPQTIRYFCYENVQWL